MGWREFISTTWWPVVVITAIVVHGGPLRRFVDVRMNSAELEAGPAKIKLSGAVQQAADEALQAASTSLQESGADAAALDFPHEPYE